MKLRPDEFYYIITKGNVLFEEVPKDIADKIEQYKNEYYTNDSITLDRYWQLIDALYSYIEIIDLAYNIEEINIDENYVIYKAIIKIRGKYYTFNYKDGLDCDYKEQAMPFVELKEVKPVEVTITKYI